MKSIPMEGAYTAAVEEAILITQTFRPMPLLLRLSSIRNQGEQTFAIQFNL